MKSTITVQYNIYILIQDKKIHQIAKISNALITYLQPKGSPYFTFELSLPHSKHITIE